MNGRNAVWLWMSERAFERGWLELARRYWDAYERSGF
jgi:hypothetical protein